MKAVTVWRTLEPGETAYLVRSLETGDQAVMVTRRYRLSDRERWSWKLGAVVQLHKRRRATMER